MPSLGGQLIVEDDADFARVHADVRKDRAVLDTDPDESARRINVSLDADTQADGNRILRRLNDIPGLRSPFRR